MDSVWTALGQALLASRAAFWNGFGGLGRLQGGLGRCLGGVGTGLGQALLASQAAPTRHFVWPSIESSAENARLHVRFLIQRGNMDLSDSDRSEFLFEFVSYACSHRCPQRSRGLACASEAHGLGQPMCGSSMSTVDVTERDALRTDR